MINYAEDMEKDKALIAEMLRKFKTMEGVAAKLSEEFTSRYGPDFGGFVKIEYNLVDESWLIKTSNGKKRQLESIDEIPMQLKFFRQESAKKFK